MRTQARLDGTWARGLLTIVAAAGVVAFAGCRSSSARPRNGTEPGHRDDRQQRNEAQVSSLLAPGGSTHDRVPQTGRAAADREAGDAVTIGRAPSSYSRTCARPQRVKARFKQP